MKSFAGSVKNVSTIRLECRFGRRVFEIRMKKNDKIRTLLQTLPRIIGEDVDSMVLFKDNIALNPNRTLVENNLKNDDCVRMMHEKSINSFLSNYNPKSEQRRKMKALANKNIQA